MKHTIKKAISIMLSVLFSIQFILTQTSAQAPVSSKPIITNENHDTRAAPKTPLSLEDVNKTPQDAESPIVGEDISKRSDSAKHFRLANGSFIAAAYGSSVHYEENGQWKEIDNTLVLKDGAYRAENGEMKVALPTHLGDGKNVELTYGKYTIKLAYVPVNEKGEIKRDAVGEMAKVMNPDATQAERSFEASKFKDSELDEAIKEYNQNRMAAKKASSQVTYAEIQQGTRIDYIVNARGIKENIVVSLRQAEYRYVFTLDTGGLLTKQNEDGSIALYEKGNEKEPVFTLCAPYMEDAKGERSDAVKMELSGGLKAAAPEQTDGLLKETETPEMTPESTKELPKPTEVSQETKAPTATPENTPQSTNEAGEASKLSSKNAAPKTTGAESTPGNTEEGAEETKPPAGTKSPDITPEATPHTMPESVTAQDRITITLTADAQWVNAKDRAFPVTIDPTVEWALNVQTILDSFVASSRPNQNYGGYHRLYAGYGGDGGDPEYAAAMRAYIKFDLQSTIALLPKNYMIINANFTLLQESTTAAGSDDPFLNLYECTSYWESGGITWNTQPSASQTALDYSTFLGYSPSEEISAHYCSWDITKIAKKWFENYGTIGYANNGFMLKSTDETSDGKRIIFYSSDYPFGGSTSTYAPYNHPTFTIIYRDNRGLEGYWSYASFNAGGAGTAHINEYSGNLVFSRTDASTFGLNLPVSVGHVYNGYMAGENYGVHPSPNLSLPGKSGLGWKLTTQQTIRRSQEYGMTDTMAENYPFVYEDGDGTAYFLRKYSELPTPTPDASTTPAPSASPTPTPYCVDEDGLGLSLLEVTEGGKDYYKLYDDKGNYSLFGRSAPGTMRYGRIEYSYDANGNKAEYVYGIQSPYLLDGIYDGARRTLSFEYTSIYDQTYVSAIVEDASRRRCEFAYNCSAGGGVFLTSIMETDGTLTTFDYDENGNLISARDVNTNYELRFAYWNASGRARRVKSVLEKVGSTEGLASTFNYDKYNTTVIRAAGVDGVNAGYSDTSDDDIFTTVQFDDAGRATAAYSQIGSDSGKALSAESLTYMGSLSAAADTTADLKQRNRVKASAGYDGGAMNILQNGSFENSGGGWSLQFRNGTVSATDHEDATRRYFGLKSRKIAVTSSSGATAEANWQNNIGTALKPNTKYTVSAYVRTENIYPVSGGYGATIAVNNGGTHLYGEYLTGTTSTTINTGWRRIQLSFSTGSSTSGVDVRGCIRGATGTAYFDGFQLEEGEGATSFNMVENGGFESGSSGWSLTNSSTSTAAKHDGSYSLTITGSPSQYANAYQLVPISGTESDTYVISGWGKANSAPYTFGSGPNAKSFALQAHVKYSDDHWKYNTYTFNASVEDWQYLSAVVSLDDGDESMDRVPTEIRIDLRYDQQINTAYFDGICLTKEISQSYVYDKDGNLVSAAANAKQKSNMEYENDDLTKYVDIDGSEYTYEYDDNHNMTKAISSRGVMSEYAYNERGQATGMVVQATANPDLKMKSTLGYSEDGSFVEAAYDANGWDTRSAYDESTGLLKSSTDVFQRRTVYEYTSDTQQVTSVKRVSDTGAALRRVDYEYDSRHRLSRVLLDGMSYAFSYNAWGQQLSVSVVGPDGTPKPLVQNQYHDKTGALQKVTYANNDYMDYVYDQTGALSQVKFNGVTRYSWQYSDSGVVSREKDHVSGREHSYMKDSIGRLIRSTVRSTSNGKTLFASEYTYDDANNVAKLAVQVGGLNYQSAYEYAQGGGDNLPQSHTAPNLNREHTYIFDGLNRLTKDTLDFNTPLAHEYQYAAAEVRGDGYTTNQISMEEFGNVQYDYTYDRIGNITQIKKSGGENTRYQYDEFNRLVREDNKDLDKTYVYTYDAGGNITSKEEYSYSTAAVLPSPSPAQVKAYTYDSQWKDKLVSYNGEPISYDAIGNPWHYLGYEMVWDGRQLAYVGDAHFDYDYSYGSDGLRTKKVVKDYRTYPIKESTTEYCYLGGKLMYEQTGDDAMFFSYDSFGNVSFIGLYSISADVIGADFYPVCNTRGDVVALYTTGGTLHATYEYDAWGNCTIYDGSGNIIDPATNPYHIAVRNPIRYRGYYYDQDTGFYYLQSRYYDPVTGRFINADGLVSTGTGFDGYNMFAYCNNNPILYVDPTGDLTKAQALKQAEKYKAWYKSAPFYLTEYALTPAQMEAALLAQVKISKDEVEKPKNSEALAVAQTLYGEDGYYEGSTGFEDHYAGRMAVALVILNRVERKEWASDPYGVATQQSQFGGYLDGKAKYEANKDKFTAKERVVWDHCVRLANVLCGSNPTALRDSAPHHLPPGCVYFVQHNPTKNVEPGIRIGANNFWYRTTY